MSINLGLFATVNGHVSLVADTFTMPMQAQVIAQLGHGLDPSCVPMSALQGMGRDPRIYLADQTITGIVRRPDLYNIKHSDPAVKATHEALLWPILSRLAVAGARAFAYGSVPVKMRMVRKTVRIRVSTKDGTKTRWKTVGPLTFYDKVDETRPDLVSVQVDENNELASLTHDGKTYGPETAHVFRWDAEFGSWCGQGARRRAWRDYCEYLLDAMLENMYLERSVDPPRIAYSEQGTTKVGGVEVDNRDLMTQIGMGLRGGGLASLPGKMDDKGNRLFGLDVLDIPERSEVWERALQRRAGNMLLAYLVAPSLGGVDDLGGAAGKTMDGLLREFVENLAGWMAVENLQPIVDRVHAWNYGSDVETPEVGVSDVGKAAAKKNLLALAQLVNSQPQGEIAWRTDVPGLIDRLGGPLRDAPPAPFDVRSAPAPVAGGEGGDEPGRKRDPLGEREERREDARDEDGEEATGAEDESDA